MLLRGNTFKCLSGIGPLFTRSMRVSVKNQVAVVGPVGSGAKTKLFHLQPPRPRGQNHGKVFSLFYKL